MEACCMLIRPSTLLVFSSTKPALLSRWNLSGPSRLFQMQASNTRFRACSVSQIRMFSGQKESAPSPAVKAVPVEVARDLLTKSHRYLDVRTSEEFGAGHVEGAVNIPYLKRAGPGMTKNLNFVEEVSNQFNKSDDIVVGCQAGKRSQMATSELAVAGFTGLVDMSGGYSAWVQSGMPTTTKS